MACRCWPRRSEVTRGRLPRLGTRAAFHATRIPSRPLTAANDAWWESLPALPPAPRGRMLARVTRGSIAEAFYAGLYAEVLARTIDGPTLEVPDEDTAFVVGALAFVGRLEEAGAVLRSWRHEGGAPSVAHLRGRVASRFFLGVAYIRAGRHD